MFLLTIFSVLTRCLGFIFKIYLTKIMSTTELGIYNITLSIYMVIITLVGSSIPLSLSKITSSNLSQNKANETKYSITSSLIMNTVFSILLVIILLTSQPIITLIIGDRLGYEIILYLIPSIIFTAIYAQIRGYLWGLENYFAVSMVEFIEQILRIGFCILFTSTNWIESPAISVGVSLSIACGISTIYGTILYFKNGGRFKYKSGYFKDIIKSSLPLTGMRLSGSILQPIVSLILPLMLSTTLGMSKSMALSQIGIVLGMTLPLLSIPSTIIGALCMILIPKINLDSSNDNIKYQINNYLRFTITCIYIFIPIFIILGPQICNYVFGNIDAGIYMQVCAWTIIPLGLSQITTSILNALSQEQKTFLYFIYSSSILIIMVCILPRFLGVMSMLFAYGCSSMFLTILNLWKIKKLTHIKTNTFKSTLYHSLLCIPVIILNSFLYNILIKNLPIFFALMITCILSALSYIGLLFVFGFFEINVVKEYLSKFTKKKLAKNQ